MNGGASANVGSITTSVHTATHCDAPFHYNPAGCTADRIPLEVFIGRAAVVDVSGSLDDWQKPLKTFDTVPARVLFRTGGWPDTSCFPESIPVMTGVVVDWLAERGVQLIGVDLPSVDNLDSKTLEIHHALGRAGITIVEGLWLEDVPDGEYELVAAPLKMMGTDGAPLRALLRVLEARE